MESEAVKVQNLKNALTALYASYTDVTILMPKKDLIKLLIKVYPAKPEENLFGPGINLTKLLNGYIEGIKFESYEAYRESIKGVMK